MLQAGRLLNARTFLSWVWKSVYQASVIMFLTIMIFNDSFIMLISVSFTSLIGIEMLNVLQEVNNIENGMIVAIASSLFVYFLSVLCLPTLF